MLTIQSILLVLLGLLLAGLAALLVGPSYRARIVRLTTERLKQAMPLTEAEIRADKDRLRADYALHIHKQSLELNEARAATARQMIDVNRRDAEISRLSVDAADLRSRLEEGGNARRVLEQTIQDRLPRVEHRLAEAKKLIFQRDRDIATLTSESEKTLRALDEAMQINMQQRSELARMQASAVSRGATTNESLADPKFDAEVALRSEIENLREQNRDQAALIARLQGTLSGAAGSLESVRAESARVLGDTDVANTTAPGPAVAGQAGARDKPTAASDLIDEVRRLRSETQDQGVEISRLKAALATYVAGAGDAPSLSVKDSRMAMKSKLSSLQAQTDAQNETIRKLRSEVAAANERLARQAQHFMDEMRRLGAGTLPAAAPSRRRPEGQIKRSLTERISQVNPKTTETSAPSPQADNDTSAPAAAAIGPGKLRGIAAQIRALSEDAGAAQSALSPEAKADVEALAPALEVAASDVQAPTTDQPARRGRLLERIADLGKTS